MAKKRSESSQRAARPAKSAKLTKKAKIDFSDIPELTEEEIKNGRRVGRPKSDVTKQLIAIRIDPRLLSKLKKLATKRKKPYQSLMHELLESAIEDEAA